jgi:hypothetical protein
MPSGMHILILFLFTCALCQLFIFHTLYISTPAFIDANHSVIYRWRNGQTLNMTKRECQMRNRTGVLSCSSRQICYPIFTYLGDVVLDARDVCSPASVLQRSLCSRLVESQICPFLPVQNQLYCLWLSSGSISPTCWVTRSDHSTSSLRHELNATAEKLRIELQQTALLEEEETQKRVKLATTERAHQVRDLCMHAQIIFIFFKELYAQLAKQIPALDPMPLLWSVPCWCWEDDQSNCLLLNLSPIDGFFLSATMFLAIAMPLFVGVWGIIATCIGISPDFWKWSVIGLLSITIGLINVPRGLTAFFLSWYGFAVLRGIQTAVWNVWESCNFYPPSVLSYHFWKVLRLVGAYFCALVISALIAYMHYDIFSLLLLPHLYLVLF